MRQQDKKLRKRVKAMINSPPEDFLEEIKLYKYCPLCQYNGKANTCPKDTSKMKKVTKKNPYQWAKSMLKIMIDLNVISADDLHRAELIKLAWSYKVK